MLCIACGPVTTLHPPEEQHSHLSFFVCVFLSDSSSSTIHVLIRIQTRNQVKTTTISSQILTYSGFTFIFPLHNPISGECHKFSEAGRKAPSVPVVQTKRPAPDCGRQRVPVVQTKRPAPDRGRQSVPVVQTKRPAPDRGRQSVPVVQTKRPAPDCGRQSGPLCSFKSLASGFSWLQIPVQYYNTDRAYLLQSPF
jgi:hypothetical protein